MKEKNLKVTIGICSRNEKHTIENTIESVLAQDFPHDLMEIIFVDDSDDETFLIIKNYVPRIDLEVKLLHGLQKGLGRARNFVVENAKGEYIVWVDADIVLPKDHIRKQVEFMEKNPNVGICKAHFFAMPQKGLPATLENLEFLAINYIISKRKKSDVVSYLSGGSIHRTKAIRKIGGFDTGIRGAGEDEEIEWRMTQFGWSTSMGSEATYFEWRKRTWKALWDNHFWYGYGAHYLYHKKTRTVKALNVMSGFLFSHIAYQLTHRKIAFLLLFQYYFKRIAWLLGLIKAHLDGYGHN